MKKIFIFFFALSTLFVVFTSCKNDDPAADKGELVTATYNASTKTFALKYASGYTNTVNAAIDNSVTPPGASATLNDGTIVSVSDANTSGEATITTSAAISNNKYVNRWIYDQMSIYYLWNNKLSKNPNYSLNPADFFNSILYKYNATTNPEGDRFSWIQEDYVELLKNLNGVSSDEIGFEYTFVWADQAKTHYYALVLYPMTGTDADAKGIDRGRFITKINGQNITPQNYKTLFGGTGTKNLSMADWRFDSATSTYNFQNSGDVAIQMHSDYAENPVYKDSVYTIDNKKIGYLVYNFFARDKGDDSYDYDKLLMNRLDAMKAQGINEMVLDLRYNSGGAVSSAIALASALVKNRSISNVLTTSQYNSIVHNALLKEYGANYNKDYFISQIDTAKIDDKGNVIAWVKITDVPSLNLPRLYVLTSGWTASASEFIINGLKPYMEVILIGETTYGKNVGSISIYEEEDPKNKWGMQPIVVKYFNSEGKSDFTAGFTPNYEVDEFNPDGMVETGDELFLFEFGNTNDPLLGKAISLITGTTRAARTTTLPVSSPFRSSQVDNKATFHMQDKHRFDMLDDVRGDEIRKLMEK
ncbi:S41 family peptidase [Proteiniphilum sp. UBA1028]|uniref:S41 family peptidase n=1 Tax=Proteiniphilum sp. UBA1028 TaxID=1947251 RepID=UPI0025D083A1|nr:S41 family peptidase [Proteiniphilum sp. UBA1028]